MAGRAFVDAKATSEGIRYGIGESGLALIDLLGGPYNRALRQRCAWVARELGSRSDAELEALLGVRGSLWSAHFISTDGSLIQAAVTSIFNRNACRLRSNLSVTVPRTNVLGTRLVLLQ